MRRKVKTVGAFTLAVVMALSIAVPISFADEPAAKTPEANSAIDLAKPTAEALTSPADNPAAKPLGETNGSSANEKNQARHTVSYKFENAPSWRPLVSEAKELLPASQSNVENGTKVVPPAITPLEIKANNGIWRFQGWDKPEATVDGANVTFVGKWVLDQYKPLFASYDFVASMASKKAGYDKLPQEVLALLPLAREGLKNGDVVNHPLSAGTEVKVEGGKWVFDGWPSGNTSTIDGNLLTTGSWTFKKDKPAPAPATASRVILNVHLSVNGKRSFPTADTLDKMKPALVAADGTRVEPLEIASNGFSFNFKDVPEGDYALEFSMPQEYRFLAGSTGSMGAYVNSGDTVQVKAGRVVRNIYTQLELIPKTTDPADPGTDQGSDSGNDSDANQGNQGGDSGTNPGVDQNDEDTDQGTNPDPDQGNQGAGQGNHDASQNDKGAGSGAGQSDRGIGQSDPSANQSGTVRSNAPSTQVSQAQLNNAKTLPQTGDESGMAIVGIVGVAAAAGLSLVAASLAKTRRKSRR